LGCQNAALSQKLPYRHSVNPERAGGDVDEAAAHEVAEAERPFRDRNRCRDCDIHFSMKSRPARAGMTLSRLRLQSALTDE
jgi:hypothetical protein